MKYIKLFLLLLGTISIVLVLLFARAFVKSLEEVGHIRFEHSDVLKNGDLLFHTSSSSQSLPIQKATGSPYSHVGIVLNQGDTAIFVFEAVQPVKLTPIDEWIARGVEGSFKALRLRDEELSERQIRDMSEMGQRWLGTDYDRNFEWDNDLMYCSELVWKLYSEAAGIELCDPIQVKNLDLDHPEVRSFIQTRFGGIDQVPAEAFIVTPADLYDSELLMTVL